MQFVSATFVGLFLVASFSFVQTGPGTNDDAALRRAGAERNCAITATRRDDTAIEYAHFKEKFELAKDKAAHLDVLLDGHRRRFQSEVAWLSAVDDLSKDTPLQKHVLELTQTRRAVVLETAIQEAGEIVVMPGLNAWERQQAAELVSFWIEERSRYNPDQ